MRRWNVVLAAVAAAVVLLLEMAAAAGGPPARGADDVDSWHRDRPAMGWEQVMPRRHGQHTATMAIPGLPAMCARFGDPGRRTSP